MESPSQPIPQRLYIGVTGKRSLLHEERILQCIREGLDREIGKLYTAEFRAILGMNHAGAPLLSVLTPLAEGADRLVAREVLSRPGAVMDVVLPMLSEDYIDTFSGGPGSEREFKDLLSQAREILCLRDRTFKEEYADPESRKKARDNAYKAVGNYVAENCDVLIAIWDGAEAGGEGGTKRILDQALQKNKPIIKIVFSKESVEMEFLPGKGLDLAPFASIRKFNKAAIDPAELAGKTRVLSRHAGAPPHVLEQIRGCLLPAYCKASNAANFNQKLYKAASLSVFVLSAVAVGGVALGAVFHVLSLWGFILELLVLSFMLVLFRTARHFRWQATWIENRYLAERLRAAMFMAACGMNPSPIRLPPQIGHAHRPNDWMIRVFKEVWGQLDRQRWIACHGSSTTVSVEFIREEWIGDQIKYHRKTLHRNAAKSHGIEKIGLALFACALVFAALHLILAWAAHGSALHLHWLETGLTLCAIVFPAVGASLAGIRSHGEYVRLAQNSLNMEENLGEMDLRMSWVMDTALFQALLRETEELMLRETQEWLLLMRFVVLELA